MPSSSRRYGKGYLIGKYDPRDYTEDNEKVKPMLMSIPNINQKLPPKMDLRQWCTPIDDQGLIGSCTAHAASSVVEFFQQKVFNKHKKHSRLFIYKVTRNLMHESQDAGAYLRTTLGALVLFGATDEEYWPYNPKRVNVEPDAFNYAYAQNFKTLKYFRHDPENLPKEQVVNNIKKYLAAGIPSMIGFETFPSLKFSTTNGGLIAFPTSSENANGGHAVAVVGYDDEKTINSPMSVQKSKGAFLIKNSWGTKWGENGYGWLPYDYVLFNKCHDCWSIIDEQWVDTQTF